MTTLDKIYINGCWVASSGTDTIDVFELCGHGFGSSGTGFALDGYMMGRRRSGYLSEVCTAGVLNRGAWP